MQGTKLAFLSHLHRGEIRGKINDMPVDKVNPTRVGVCGFCLPQAQLFRDYKCLEVQ